jgi:shikimate kinase
VNLILIGYRGSGKSTVGAILAERLLRRFVDLDRVVTEQAGKPIQAIFAEEGEEGFRQRERQALLGVRKSKNSIVALGGGALLNEENRPLTRRLGKVVWLRAPAVVLWSRIRNDPETLTSRPNLTPAGGLAEIEALLVERERTYRAVAHHAVDTVSCTPEAVADAIEIWFRAGDGGKD